MVSTSVDFWVAWEAEKPGINVSNAGRAQGYGRRSVSRGQSNPVRRILLRSGRVAQIRLLPENAFETSSATRARSSLAIIFESLVGTTMSRNSLRSSGVRLL